MLYPGSAAALDGRAQTSELVIKETLECLGHGGVVQVFMVEGLTLASMGCDLCGCLSVHDPQPRPMDMSRQGMGLPWAPSICFELILVFIKLPINPLSGIGLSHPGPESDGRGIGDRFAIGVELEESVGMPASK